MSFFPISCTSSGFHILFALCPKSSLFLTISPSLYFVTLTFLKLCCFQSISHAWLFVTPWTVARQASLHGISQARILEWVTIPFSRGSSQPRNWTRVSCISCIGTQLLYHWAAVHGVVKSRTWLSDFPFTFHFPALEKEMATRSSVLAWRIPGTGQPCGLLSMGSHNWSDLAAAAAAGRIWIWEFFSYQPLSCFPFPM